MQGKPLSALTLTRVGMFVVLSLVIFSMLGVHEAGKKAFILVTMLLLAASHFMYFTEFGKKYPIVFLAADFILCSGIGFAFGMNDSLYLIYFGVLAVSVHLYTEDKKVRRLFYLLFFLVWAAILATVQIRYGEIQIVSNFVSFTFVIHGGMVGNLIKKLMNAQQTVAAQYEQLNQSHDALKEAHGQLREYSRQVEELTEIRERNRIAREIHDTVGHKMTALLIQMQLAREVMDANADLSKEALMKCDQLTREALQEVRLSVRTLHEEDGENLTLIKVLQKMLQDFSQMTGLSMELKVEGDVSSVPTTLQPTITRIVQESITNAKRHGGATSCKVEILCTEAEVNVTITDNGEGSDGPVPGFGILNMRERVMEHGGSLHYRTVQGEGFTVSAELPLKVMKWSLGGVS